MAAAQSREQAGDLMYFESPVLIFTISIKYIILKP
jgi:hypothetical protein